MYLALEGTTVLVKLTGSNPATGKMFQALPITVDHFDGQGLWFRDSTLSDEFAAGEYHAVKMPIGPKPQVFLPLSRIEWLMVPDKTC
jgi:hypothetical protein